MSVLFTFTMQVTILCLTLCFTSLQSVHVSPSIDLQESGSSQECESSIVEETIHDDKEKVQETTANDDNNSECRVYLAESSIPNSGLGMYAGVHFKKGDTVGQEDIILPIIDLEKNRPEDKLISKAGPWILSDYTWYAADANAHFEADSVDILMTGLGMVANSHPGLFNVDKSIPLTSHKMDRFRDYGAGAVTDMPLVKWYADQNIPSGMELLVDYGAEWFEARIEEIGYVPDRIDFENAEHIVEEFLGTVYEKYAPNIRNDLWKLVRDEASPETKSALPQKAEDLNDAMERGLGIFSIPNIIKSQEWLKSHGQCMDNLQVKKSTLQEAGRGAFATRLIPKGSLVAPAPLVHILDKYTLNMYDKYKQVSGKQLLLNYCFGHRNSSVLLFPYSSVVNFINHNMTKANAELKWSKNPYHHSEWLEREISDLIKEKRTGLLFDIIATRDILPDEEVFINYGEEWESAWNNHVRNWIAPDECEKSIQNPDILNADQTSPLRTISEQQTNPYPKNIGTACFFDYMQEDEEKGHPDPNNSKVIIFPWDEIFSTDDYHFLRPCKIIQVLERKDPPNTFDYTVAVYNYKGLEKENRLPKNKVSIVTRMPRSEIRFVELQYRSNIHLRGAFRHPIGIPDDIFPPAWIMDAF